MWGWEACPADVTPLQVVAQTLRMMECCRTAINAVEGLALRQCLSTYRSGP